MYQDLVSKRYKHLRRKSKYFKSKITKVMHKSLRRPNPCYCQRRRSYILHIVNESRAVSKGGIEPFQD